MRRALLPLLLLGSAAAAAGAEDPPSLAGCEAMVRADPGSFEGYECIASLPRRTGDWEGARRRLQAYVAADPGNHLARLGLGALESSQGRDRAAELLRDAAEGLRRDRRPVEEVRARLTLAVFYFIRGRKEDAEPQLEMAERVAAATGDPVLQARVLNIQGRAASQEQDLGRAWRIFKRVEAMIVPDGPPAMQAFCLSMLGIVCEELGRYPQAMDYHRRAAAIQHDMGDSWAEARSRANVAQYATHFWAEGSMSREQALEVVRGALEATVRAGTRSTEGRMRVRLAELLDDTAAEEQLRRALQILRELRDARGISMAARALSQHLAGTGRRDEADAFLDDLLATARGNWERDQEARALLVQAAVHEEAGEIDEAVATYRDAIEVIESIRDLQGDDVTQVRFFSEWVTAYRRLFGLLLEPAGTPPTDERLRQAFAVSERMRARALLDALDSAGATAALAPSGPAAEERRALLGEMAELQRRLVAGEISEAERASSLQRLAALEVEEAAIRRRLAQEDRRFGRLRRPDFPDLGRVQQALSEQEAMLSFQVARRENRDRFAAMGGRGGGSWVLVLTRHEARVHPLPGRLALEPAVRAFLGLVERGDGAEVEAAATLHGMLLGDALADLPAGIEQITLIPDGVLHHLPFAALRASAGEEPLGLRFRLGRAPSATTWLHMRAGAGAPPEAPVVALADPPPPGGGDAPSATRSWALGSGLELGPLPHARGEARFLAGRLGPRSLVRVGEEATEHFVKHADLARFAILHLAAHAVVDDENPPRSAILLAPGVEEEDGLLQIREIVDLDLEGRLVVLSACRSASGAVLRGEGVLGLARAFFQAGARAVVGSLWPLRDDQAAAFFEPFYERLSEGASAAEALQHARRARARAGAPASTWAGIVLLGDGAAAPLPEGSRRVAEHGAWLAGAAALLLAAAALAAIRARRRGATPR